jgi:HSP20 family protein
MLARWAPLVNEFERVRREMDRMWEALDPRSGRPGLAGTYPLLNVMEDDERLYVEAELPGIDLNKLNVTVLSTNELSIEGERRPVEIAGTWHRQERGVGQFKRVVNLPVPVDAEKVEARYEQGVLTVVLPKSQLAKPRQIAVKAE